MCEWGDTVTLELSTAASMSHTDMEYRRTWGIDSCIAPIVSALDAGGIKMLGSCCGHGRGLGEILLEDGRKLLVDS